MNSTRYYYLLTDLVFAGSAIVIIWHRHKRELQRHRAFILDFMLFSLPFAYLDRYALKWGAWQYNPTHNLGFAIFGEEIEGYLFLALVAIAVASYTVANAKVYGYKVVRKSGTKAHKLPKNKRQKLIPVTAHSKR